MYPSKYSRLCRGLYVEHLSLGRAPVTCGLDAVKLAALRDHVIAYLRLELSHTKSCPSSIPFKLDKAEIVVHLLLLNSRVYIITHFQVGFLIHPYKISAL